MTNHKTAASLLTIFAILYFAMCAYLIFNQPG